jgi:predicted Zn-dependent protease
MVNGDSTLLRRLGTSRYCRVVFCMVLAAASASAQTPADYFDPANQNLLYQLKRNHLDPGLKELESGQLNEAQADVDFLLRYVPNHVEGLLLNEAIAKSKHLPEKAMSRYVQALQLYPDHAITHAQLGAYLLDLGRVDAAIESLNTAVRLEPRLAMAHGYLARAYRRKGDPARASAEEAEAHKYSGRGGTR